MKDDVKNTPIEGEVVENTTPDHSKVVEFRTVEDVMEDNFFRYSMSVIIDRALPDVRDGLKPVHRRILYSMNQNGNRSGAKFVKAPVSSVTLWVSITRTVTRQFIIQWCALPSHGRFATH